MIERIGNTRFQVYAFDVESHADEESQRLRETSIWLSSFIDENSRMEDEGNYFYTIEDWLRRLEEITCQKRTAKKKPVRNVLVYIYNLSWEWSFILPVLLKEGFKWVPKVEKDGEKVFSSVSTRSCSSVWTASFQFRRNCGKVVLRDLCKIFPGGLGKMARTFGLPTKKGEIDYTLNRRHGWVPTREEKEYCFRDTKIVMDVLEIMQKRDDRDFWKSVSAASYACRKMIAAGFPRSHHKMKAFRWKYPLLEKEETEFLRKTVAGGLTYATSAYQFLKGKVPLFHIDAHQMHPSQAFSHSFPRGKGRKFQGAPRRSPFVISACHIRFSYSGVRLHSVISLIGKDICSDEDLWLWDFEIPLLRECYEDPIIEYVDGYEYDCGRLPWRKWYSENYCNRLKAKAEGDQFGITYWKLLNNSSYGKLLEKGHESKFENIVLDDGRITSLDHPNEEARDGGSYTYLPVGSAIPAYSRVCLIRMALRFGWRNIVYFDTDSIFGVLNEETRKVLKRIDYTDFLGGWGREADIDEWEFDAPKRYKIVERDGDERKLVVHMAGVNFGKEDFPTDPECFDDLDLIEGTYDIQGSIAAKGGKILVLKRKVLKVQPKYEGIFKKNRPDLK